MKPSHPFHHLSLAALALVAFLAAGTPAYGQLDIPGYPADIGAHDPREIAMLPRYCIFTPTFVQAGVPGSNDVQALNHWQSVMGEAVFKGMHHYCWAMMKTNRANFLAPDRPTRQAWLEISLNEFDYVIAIAPRDFILLPEILTKKGENLIALGKSVQGLGELLRAIDLKADYWPPYAQISDYYKANGDRQKAREFLEKGLSLSPDANALKRRIAELNTTNDLRKPPPPRSAKEK